MCPGHWKVADRRGQMGTSGFAGEAEGWTVPALFPEDGKPPRQGGVPARRGTAAIHASATVVIMLILVIMITL